MGAGPLFNFGIASTSALVISTFGLTTAQFGLILTVVFTSAAVVSLVLGWLADRLPPRVQWCVLFGGAALSLFLAGLAGAAADGGAGEGAGAFGPDGPAPAYGFLLATAVLSGITQSMSNPTTNRAVTALATPRQRIGWIGVKQSGVQVGQFAAGVLFPPLALWLGWAGATWVVAGLCLVLLVGSLTLIPDWSRGPSGLTTVTAPVATGAGGGAGAGAGAAADATGAHEPGRASAPDAAPSRPTPTQRETSLIVALLAAISFLSALGVMSTNGYLALFAVEQFGYPLVLGGLLVALGGLIGVVSRVWWAREFARGASAGVLFVIMSIGSIAAATLLTLSAVAHIAWFVWVAVVLHGVSVLGANVVVNASVISVVGKARLGLATGVTATGMYAGFALGPIIAGALVDATGGFAGGWIAIGIGYVLCLGVSIAVLRVTRRFRPARGGRR